jgi:hypothetical protein
LLDKEKEMPRKSYLWNTQKELIKIGGVGDFGADHQPVEVSNDVAHQYSTKEATDAGWMVTWGEESTSAPAPNPPQTVVLTSTPKAMEPLKVEPKVAQTAAPGVPTPVVKAIEPPKEVEVKK